MRKKIALIFLLFGLPITGIVVLGVLGTHKFNKLPYYSLEGRLDSLSSDAHQVGEFSLLNQNSEQFGSEDLEGKVWIAAFFATNSEHVGATTKQLLWPNWRYRNKEEIAIVCFTLNPEYDTPEVLTEYVNKNTRYNTADNWQFLTGDKSVIDKIIEEEFLITRDSIDPGNIATLWLVDANGYLRGVYHAASEDALRDATEDIALLKKEMDVLEHARRKEVENVEQLTSDRNTPPVLGPEGHTIPPFSFMGIDSVEISNRDLEGRIKIVDYFFTNCPTICPILSSQLLRTQSILNRRGLGPDKLIILSHSVDPERDSPHQMDLYAQSMDADTSQWKFLTGDKADLYDQARTGYFLTALESDTAAGGFFHSDIFVLVDTENRIRGFYDGTSTSEVDEMILDIHKITLESKLN
jgi:protein SCO1/2